MQWAQCIYTATATVKKSKCKTDWAVWVSLFYYGTTNQKIIAITVYLTSTVVVETEEPTQIIPKPLLSGHNPEPVM
jgi:hypothetical protein